MKTMDFKNFVYFRSCYTLNMAKKDTEIVCECTHEEKMKCETFTQNGCYGNSHTLFEVVFYSIDALLALLQSLSMTAILFSFVI